MDNSSGVNGSLGMTNERSGMSKRITTGNPIAATCCALAGPRGHDEARTYRLRDGKGRTKSDELDSDKQDQTGFADVAERLVGRGE